MLNIKIAGKDEVRELKAKEQLERLLNEYDLKKYLFTNDVIIEYFVQPHSHPILTLNTRQIDNDDAALSTFLHEQIHWYLDKRSEETEQAIKELKEIYSEVPVGGEDGAKSEYSTYLHLIVNFLEHEELTKLVGEERANKVSGNPFGYKWIYKKVLDDNKTIRAILAKNKLLLEDTTTVFFKPTEEFTEKANKIFEEQRKRIAKLLPTADIQHIGSTAIPTSITKGDLDIVVRVEEEEFPKAVEALRSLYQINQPENWSVTFASFKDDDSYDLPFGAQLQVKGSDYDDMHTLRDILIDNPNLLEEYNQMKLKFEGKDMNQYRKIKSDFFDKLRTYKK